MSDPRGIVLKSGREIEMMRAAGRVVHKVLTRIGELARPGVSTAELNGEAERMIAGAGGVALFKGVRNREAKFPFPAALCTSVNDELVHGIPNEKPLKSGDVLSVDCGVRLNGYCGDSAVTLAIGDVSNDGARLLKTTREALECAVREIRPGLMWSEIASKMQGLVESAGMSVVRDFVGHGIGRDMHEEPKIPNYWDTKQRALDFQLVPGMVLAVEPMVNLGGPGVKYADADRWVVVTRDGKLAAHFEHTIAVTQGGADVLTDGR